MVKARKLPVAIEVPTNIVRPPELRCQGNLAHYSPNSLHARFALRKHPQVLKALQEMWDKMPKQMNYLVDWHIYFWFAKKLAKELVPHCTEKDLLRSIREVPAPARVESCADLPADSWASLFAAFGGGVPIVG